MTFIQRVSGGWRNGDGDPPRDVPPSDEGRSGDLGPPPPVFREGLGGGSGGDEPPPYTAGEGQPPPAERRWWPRIVAIGSAVLVLLILLNIGVDVYVDRLWFGNIGYRGVFDTRVITQVWLFVAGAGVAAVVLAATQLVAWRMPVDASAPAMDDRGLTRLIAVVSVAATVLLAIIFGSVAAGNWELILQFLNAKSFGQEDAQFGRDIGFYVFELEALQFIKSWATGLAIMAMLLTAAVYGVRLLLHRGAAQSTLGVRIHLALAIAIVMALFIWSYWLARLELAVDPGGFVFGPTYTDDQVPRPRPRSPKWSPPPPSSSASSPGLSTNDSASPSPPS